MSVDPYVYSGTNVLKNKFNIRDVNGLSQAETFHTSKRIAELHEAPIKGSFDIKHLQKIHGYIFQDVYDWAGKIRTVDIAKSTLFCPVRNLDSYSQKVFGDLKKANYLQGMEIDQFSKKAAHYLGEINMIHPFREGNGRAQREFMRELALAAGYKLSLENVSGQKMIEISVQSANISNEGFEKAIRDNIKPLEKENKNKRLFDSYAKEVLTEAGQKWTENTNGLIARKMLKDNISSEQVKSALKFSPEQINNISGFVRKIENEPEIKAIKERQGRGR